MYIYTISQYNKSFGTKHAIYSGKQNNEEKQGKQGRNGETTWKREYGTRFLEIRYAENEGHRSRRCQPGDGQNAARKLRNPLDAQLASNIIQGWVFRESYVGLATIPGDAYSSGRWTAIARARVYALRKWSGVRCCRGWKSQESRDCRSFPVTRL